MNIEAKMWKIRTIGEWKGNLVVPSKRGGGSEVDVKEGGRASCTPLCYREREREREREEELNLFKQKIK